MKDTLYTGEEARARLISGIRKSAQAVGCTMGTAGANSLIEAIESPGHLSTNDGATILGAMHFEDPIEEMGRKILLEAVSRANKASGDGSSTTTVLTAAIIEEGLKFLGETDRMTLKRSLEACIPQIEEAITSQSRAIEVSEVGRVAAISAEDEQIGALIQEIYQQIGPDGIIHWDISKTAEDTYTLGNGLTVEGAGIASPYMCDRDKQSGQLYNVAKLKNPKVLITHEKLTTAAVFEQLFLALNNKGKKEVVVFCEDFDVNVIAQLVMTYQAQGFRTVVVKMPVIWGDEWREDLALATGATVIDPAAGLSLKDAKESHLGTVQHITIDKESTYIDGINDLSEHINSLESEGTDKAKNRAARLNTKTARYFVGAHSDSALSYRRLKVEDAIAAAYHALHGGIVVGGGLALVKAAENLDNPVLKAALKAPHEQIVSNMGGKSFSEKDMEAQEVFDPATIVLNAAKNAISVAASILTTETIVLLPRQEQPNSPNMPVL